jgi:hypothetical protein
MYFLPATNRIIMPLTPLLGPVSAEGYCCAQDTPANAGVLMPATPRPAVLRREMKKVVEPRKSLDKLN